MKKRCRRRLYRRAGAALLAFMVLLTSSQWFRVQAKGISTTQTGYESLAEFQVERWNTILKEVFGDTVSKMTYNNPLVYASIPSEDSMNKGGAQVRPGNKYFNWADTSKIENKWSGGSGEVTLEQLQEKKQIRYETIRYAGETVEGVGTNPTVPETEVTYTVFDVYNADQLYFVMNQVKDADYNVKINLCADIDLNGAEKIWHSDNVNPECQKADYWYYIEGNGHTIYNMKTRSRTVTNKSNRGRASFLGYLDGNAFDSKKVVLKNLNFSNCMVISSHAQSAVVIGMNTGRLYMENVNVADSFAYSSQANTGGILGRNQCTMGNMFMRNCSTSGLYLCGADHTGGFSGTFYDIAGVELPVKYDTAFPDSPESWLAQKGRTMPLMVENCYSVDSELFSVGKDGDSGAFFSCGARFICRNSFTNNIIYGTHNTGAFIGRVVNVDSNEYGMQDDLGENTVSTYFENCYASGSVEGRDKIGGFAGYDSGSRSGSRDNRGITVFKNCYTTAMTGMDYSGKQVGGFIGHESTHEGQRASIAVGTDADGNTTYTTNPGDVYINCYAAGEVGNILTETDVNHNCGTNESDAQGGFLGAVGFWGFEYQSTGTAGDELSLKKALEGESNGNYINCYYDMQTTGMRERATGKSWSFDGDKNGTPSQIPGVTGVYTLYSDAKNVMGLAHSNDNVLMSVKMDDSDSSNVWMYRDGYYPALLSFYGGAAKENFGKMNESGQIISVDNNVDISAISEDTDDENDIENPDETDGTDAETPDGTDGTNTETPDGTDGTNTETPDGTDGTNTETPDGTDETGTETPDGTDGTNTETPDGTDGTNTETPDGTDGTNTETPDGTDGTNTETPDGAEDGTNTEEPGSTEEPGAGMDEETPGGAGDETNAEGPGGTDDGSSTETAGGTENESEAESSDEEVNAVDMDDAEEGGGSENTESDGDTADAAKTAASRMVRTVRVSQAVNTGKAVRAAAAVRTADAGNIARIVSTADVHDADRTDEAENVGDADDGSSTETSGGTEESGTGTNEETSEGTEEPGTGTDEETPGGTETPGNTEEPGTGTDEETPGATEEPGTGTDEETSGSTEEPGTGTDEETPGATEEPGTGTDEETPGSTDELNPLMEFFKLDKEIEPMDLDDGEEYPAYDEDTRARIEEQLNKKALMVPNYLQASVSTVFLDHWDSAMNMDTGALGGENDWAAGLPANKLTQKEYADGEAWEQDTDGEYWEIAYKNLAAGSYELKTQAGDSWTYNFGSDKFNGKNCVLEVPEDCDVKVKFDYVAPASITVENTAYRIWAEFYHDLYDEDGNEIEGAEPFKTQVLGYNAMEDQKSTWTVVGSFSNWDKNDTKYDMNYLGTGQRNGDYELVLTLEAGTHSFQITRDHSWDECYGIDGKNGRDMNMTFTLKQKCEVSITFNENTHLTTVRSNPADALDKDKSEITEEVIDFDGYSLISSPEITGHDWLDGLEAARDGEMTYDDHDGIYTKSYTVTGKENFEKIHGYKVIVDGKNVGNRIYFYLFGPGVDAEEQDYRATLTFSYNPATGESWVSDGKDGNDTWVNNNPNVDSWNVIGSQSLTGYSWDEGMTEEEKKEMSRGRMEYDESTKLYFKVYQQVKPGTHSFKIVANGSFDSGIEYGTSDGLNFQFTTSSTSDISITFNPMTKAIHISATDGQLVHSDYVVSGTASLTGSSWNASDEENRMSYQGKDGYEDIYTKSYPVENGGKYAFKVVHYGIDDKTEPIELQVAGEADHDYMLEITYHERSASTEYRLIDMTTGFDVTESYAKPILYSSWSVLGEKGLTGYNWEDAANGNQTAAAEAGKMTDEDKDGIYTKTFADVAVSETPQVLNFKVAAEGTWDTGVSYGDWRGNNYTIVLASNEVTKCSVTITFDPDTHEIGVTASPDCLMDGNIDESGLVWYVAGDYDLVSEDAYYTAPTVYDTVRDITAPFTFTSGSHVNWNYDEDRNEASVFFSRIEPTEEEKKFDLEYEVEGKTIKGTFNEKVISLESEVDGDHSVWKCDRFMPGKQWVKVVTNNIEEGTAGSRSIRLIPTAYLEAGNDADIYVLQSESDTTLEHVANKVSYQKNSLAGENGIEGVNFEGLEDETFDRYNVALTAAYAITDRVGLGYYGNYSKQKVEKYNKDKIRENNLNEKFADDYFVMSSVFAKNASYDDGNINKEAGETSNLVIDELVDQNLIGSSYGTEDKAKAKTIIKVSRLNKDGGMTKVFTTRNTSDGTDRSKSTYEKNYLKWTGQMAFDSADEGDYLVTYYWSLSDGRYLSDSKKVTIYSGLASIKKYVNIHHFEIEETKGERPKEIEYTVTYTNPVKGNFGIVDVLPFDGDIRKDESRSDGTNSSNVGDGTVLKLKDVTVSKSGIDDVEISSIDYTTDESVRTNVTAGDHITDEMLNTGAAESILNDTSISWRNIDNLGGGDSNATAVRVLGTQGEEKGTGIITLTYTIEVSNAQKYDYYVNNAFFTVKGDGGITADGVSNPELTAAVGRELSGYVWLDSDLDGRYDASEPAIDGVKVTLKKKDGTVVRTVTSGAGTEERGYYEFADIYPDGDYEVIFEAPEGGTVTLYNADGSVMKENVNFEDLHLTRRLSKYQVTNKNLSRNIANYVGDDETAKTYYIDEYLPSESEIYANNTQPYYLEGSVTDYYFTRLYQNLGLTEVKDVEELTNSLTIVKKEGTLDGKLLDGAKFKLEYSRDGSNYQPVTYYVDDDGNYVFAASAEEAGGREPLPADAVETKNGQFKFTNLPTADYRLTEVEPPEGYNPLGAPVEFSLPYVMRLEKVPDELSGIQDGYVTGGDEHSKSDLEEGLVYYYDITYTITNSQALHMPLTGRWLDMLPLILAGILFAGSIGLYAGYRIKKRKY